MSELGPDDREPLSGIGGMDRGRWRQVKDILEKALELEPSRVPGFLRGACGDDERLRAEVESLLPGEEESDFLETPLSWAAVEGEGGTPGPERDGRIGSRVGPYRLTECLGRGGMGAVYLGVRDDGAFDREVAVKILRRGMATREVLERFERERRIVAGIEHPNIVRLLDAGSTQDGLPHFVMERVEGRPIDRYCAESGLSVRRRVELIRKVCGAVAHAHQRSIVHRDLKPGNLLVTDGGEPKVVDFGIAKALSPEGEPGGTLAPTRPGGQPLSPEFASPEQVRGEGVTPASDVYSLGVVLYRLLAGHPPYRFETLTQAEIERVVCKTDVTRPSDAATRGSRSSATVEDRPRRPAQEKISGEAAGPRPSVARGRELRGDLDAIVMKALRKEPEERYADAGALGLDLERYLAGRPVEARRGSLRYKARRRLDPRRWRRETRIGASVAAAGVAVALGLVLWGRAVRAPAGELGFAESDWVLVAEPADDGGGPEMGRAVRAAMVRGLADSRFLRVATRQRVDDALRLLGRPPGGTLDLAAAGEVAALDPRIRAIVAPRLERRGRVLAVGARLVEPRTGVAVGDFAERADGPEGLPAAATALAGRLRRVLGEDPVAVAESVGHLERSTSRSVVALGLFEEAMARWSEPVAERLLEEAVTADPGYASAHTYLAWALWNRDAPRERYLAHAERGHRLAGELPPRERYFLEASRHHMAGELERAKTAYEALLALYPDHFWAVNNLVAVCMGLDRAREALPAVVRRAEMRPNDFASNQEAAWHLVVLDGDTELAEGFALRAAELAPSDLESYAAVWSRTFPAQRAWLEGDPGPLRRRAATLRDSLAAALRGERAASREELGAVGTAAFAYLALGRFAEAEELFATLEAEAGQPLFLAVAAWLRGDLPRLRHELRRARRLPLRSPSPVSAVPSLYVRAGWVEAAEEEAAELATGFHRGYHELARGEVARGRGRTDEAIELLTVAVDHLPLPNAAYFLAAESLALAHLERRDLGAATDVLLRAARRREAAALLGNQVWWLRNQERLVDLLRRAGEVERAERLEADLRRLAPDGGSTGSR
ncbi:MAG: protein kinase [Thermoanaerobaculia bacterium]|nr:protein kinase [Thermoanaerobaculia bacterium]